MSLRGLDGQSKLLLRSLMSGGCGVRRAVEVFHRQQRANPEVSLCLLINKLCEDEITSSPTGDQPVNVKPMVCLFPSLFKHNLLSFIHLNHIALPQTSIRRLLRCLSQDLHPDPWTSALCRQIWRSLGADSDDEPLHSAQCNQRLKELCQRLAPSHENGWTKCLRHQTVESGPQGVFGSSQRGTQRKRKISTVIVVGDDDEDEDEMGRLSKRMKVDICSGKRMNVEDQEAPEETLQSSVKETAPKSPAKEPEPAADSVCDPLPQHIKAAVLQIKELLESQTEWDQSSSDVFKVLNDCDPPQVEMFCSSLSLSHVPVSTLPQVCSSVLSLSPDLSYSTAATLIRSLLLERVLSLSEPASRCLVTAVTSLCARYPRPMCHALIGPVLTEREIGNPQAELLNRLIGGCLDSHYRLLLLQMTFKVAWSEAVLSVIHSLLDSKPDISEEVFTQFTEQLVGQGAQFTKSVNFAKMMLTVLTKYSSQVTASHKLSLSLCLQSNETFLKKSLQAALKRITHGR